MTPWRITRTVRRWEDGTQDVPGPVKVIVTALMESRAVRDYFGVRLTEAAGGARQ